jgi:hypothetical protein
VFRKQGLFTPPIKKIRDFCAYGRKTGNKPWMKIAIFNHEKSVRSATNFLPAPTSRQLEEKMGFPYYFKG